MSPISTPFDAVTVTLNPAIDRTVTISNFTLGAVNRVEAVRNTAGGKGVNVASALADDGLRIAVTGLLGRENAGLFETLFAGKAIADRFVRIAGETRIGIKVADPVAHNTTDINFPGTPLSPEDIATLRKQIEALDAPWFILGGSLPPGVDPAIYRDLVNTLKALGRKVVVDTSEEPLRLVLQAAPTIIKPNIHELEALLGETLRDEEAVIAAARSLVARGIGLVVVSMGKEGACFVTADRVVIARPPDAEVRSTVGAGDAMVAGIVSAQIRGLSLEDCARLGTAFSVEVLTRGEGSQSPRTAVDAAMQQVILDVI
jgi:1-phosphofructokinase